MVFVVEEQPASLMHPKFVCLRVHMPLSPLDPTEEQDMDGHASPALPKLSK